MKNVVGTFHKIQKAYYQYCYQAVEPDGIKMSEMVCILSLYNSAPKDTARDIIRVLPPLPRHGKQKLGVASQVWFRRRIP